MPLSLALGLCTSLCIPLQGLCPLHVDALADSIFAYEPVKAFIHLFVDPDGEFLFHDLSGSYDVVPVFLVAIDVLSLMFLW